MTGRTKANICKVAPFTLPYKEGWKNYKVRIEQVQLDERKEQFVIGYPFDNIIIETNRPFFRYKNLKHRKPDVKLLIQKIPQGNHLEEFFKDIINYVDSKIVYGGQI